MAELKTKENETSVDDFINSVGDDTKKEDSKELLKILEKITGKKPKMWGKSIIGFDSYHYKYKSGREGDWPIIGFSPRKQNISIYIMPGFDKYKDLLEKLGKHKTSVSCLYIKKLEEVDLKILEKIMKDSVKVMREKY